MKKKRKLNVRKIWNCTIFAFCTEKPEIWFFFSIIWSKRNLANIFMHSVMLFLIWPNIWAFYKEKEGFALKSVSRVIQIVTFSCLAPFLYQYSRGGHSTAFVYTLFCVVHQNHKWSSWRQNMASTSVNLCFDVGPTL